MFIVVRCLCGPAQLSSITVLCGFESACLEWSASVGIPATYVIIP